MTVATPLALSVLRRLFLPLAALVLLPVHVSALDPSRHLSQYAHTAWRMQDGVFAGVPFAIAQTQDGYLWIGTAAGVLRFDGVNFVPWTPAPKSRLPSADVLGLLGARDGSLWIGTSAGLSRWKDDTLTNYPSGLSGVQSIVEDRQGTIWFPGNRAGTDSGPLCYVAGAETRCTGTASDIPPLRAWTVLEDREGSLWVGGDTGLLRWTPDSHSVHVPRGLGNNSGLPGVSAIASTPDGTLWVGLAKVGPGLGLQRLIHGRWQAFVTPEFDSTKQRVTALHADSHAALWVGTADRGLYRIHGDQVDRFDRASGLSSDQVIAIHEDREGNIWVVTMQGVDRFADMPIISFSATEGMCSPEVATVIAARDGSIWTGGEGALSNLRDGRITCLRSGEELPGAQVTSLLEDRVGRLWVGLDRGLWIREHGSFREVRREDGRATTMVTGITEDRDGNIWIAVSGPPRILMRVQGDVARDGYHDIPLPRRVAADPTGGLWLGLLNGDLAHYRDGRVHTYKFEHGESALLQQLLPDDDGSVLAATSYGLIGWHKGRQLTLDARNGLPCDEVYALTFDTRGDLWLFMNCALGVVKKADLQTWKADPATRLAMDTLAVSDGVRTGWAPFVASARSPDGRLWFANGALLQMVHPGRLQRNQLAPPVHIVKVVADRRIYPIRGVIRMPPLTRDLQIDYVGLSLAAPQKVLFRYRLEGRDTTWQEPGTRRQAFYSDLRPGTYRFRVIASNNDGVWNERGASLELVIAPAWYQTTGFLTLCAVAAVTLAWAAYRLRMRQVATALKLRFDERLSERTRMARDLHDTLLQTIHGMKMVADLALKRPDDGAAMARAMGQVSTWLGQAGHETRAAVNALRNSTTERNDLSAALQRAIDECGLQRSMDATLLVTGTHKEMHPVVRDEVYRIANEAIRNACTHSAGRSVKVAVAYTHDLEIRVADDGVGIDSVLAEQGRPGHFGLASMRERAARIGARMTIVSARGAGTEVIVTVPGRVIFQEITPLWRRLMARLRRSAIEE